MITTELEKVRKIGKTQNNRNVVQKWKLKKKTITEDEVI